jgi:(hydroxyamino)benzene mutase
MNPIPQQLLISGTVLFLLSLLIGFAIPALRNPRMGMSVHVAGVQSGIVLWALGLMWPRLELSPGMQLATQLLAVLGLYAIFTSLLLAALWGTSRATPIAGAGHQASRPREAAVTVILAGGSFASLIAIALVLWGLCNWRA